MITAVMPTYARADVAFEKGEGAYLYATDGRRFLDFTTGLAVVSLGHAHPHLTRAIQEQAGKLMHVSNLFRIDGQDKLAERLVANSFADTVFFGNSGAEANECAIKIIRRYQYAAGRPERFRVITFTKAFHGRTLATIAATGTEKVLTGFGPKMDGFDQVEVGDLDLVRAAVGKETAAILIEPIQAEGGVQMLPDGFLAGLREICDDHDLLLIFDEVQTGMGRTGKLLAHEWTGVAPDVASLGKGIGGGFPMGACLATEKAAAAMVAGTHGSTYGGNPLAVAAGNAVLDVILEDGFLERVRKISETLRGRLEDLCRRNDSIFEEVRGQGLLLGLKCRVPNMDIVTKLRDKGLLVPPADDNVVRLLPALIIEESHIDEAISLFEEVCRDMVS